MKSSPELMLEVSIFVRAAAIGRGSDHDHHNQHRNRNRPDHRPDPGSWPGRHPHHGGRPNGEHPDLLLVGRAGTALADVADEARARGAKVHELGCDLSRLADVRAAAAAARELLDSGAVRPLRALVANAGRMSADTRDASVGRV